jgi:hypothetical protein
MATYKEFESRDITTDQSFLELPVDILQTDISSSATRRQYQVWCSGGIGPGVTSSLHQTIYDQDFTYQTSNAIFDITFGLSRNSDLVNTGSLIYIDTSTNQYYFSSQSIQMREKMAIYRTFAQELLGDGTSEFTTISGSVTNTIKEPMFICFKRLFARDRMKRETTAIRVYQTGSSLSGSSSGEAIFTDAGSTSVIEQSFGGQVSTVVNSANISKPVGLLYLDRGIMVLDTQKVFDTGTNITGNIRAVSTSGFTPFNGGFNKLLVSGSIDEICNYVCSSKFSSGSSTAMAFQSLTFINSTTYHCILGADEFNYSSNPTYTDSTGRVVVINEGQEDVQRSFAFATSIGLYDARNRLLAVAKLSRPVYKDREHVIPIRVQLDF